MRTVGEILSQRRKEIGLTLDQVEKETKIRQKYLEAIEKDLFSQIQESTTVKGFVRNYAQFLGLSAENVLAVFRRDFCENEKGQIIPRGMVKPLNEKTFYWTPKYTVIGVIGLLFFGFIFFFVKQYLNFSSAPFLQITSPVENQVFKENVLVTGKTDKDATVKIDGSLITITEEGNFRENIVLPRGENIVTIESSNRKLKKRTVNIKIRVE